MRNLLLLLSSVFIIAITSCNQSNQPTTAKTQPQNEGFTVAFYNVENLFDTIHEEGKVDEEFTPTSKKKWNTKKYFHKLHQLASVIDSIGGQGYPDIVGMEEVENKAVLEDLVKQESIKQANYQIIHYESPDFRGIDNALLYNPKTFHPIYQKPIPITMPDSIGSIGGHPITSRDILYVKGIVKGQDTLHILVNHWTSMYYGEKETISHRKYCARVAKHQIDSILSTNPHANILLGGDLNEDVFGPAVMGVMEPDSNYTHPKPNHIYNLAYYLFTVKNQGTYNYRGVWGTLDHLMVSGSLLNPKNHLFTSPDNAHVFHSMMVMNKYNNRNGKGIRPNRTYGGNHYYGGFSDHLPVYLHFTNNH
jgi:hypothetical protein